MFRTIHIANHVIHFLITCIYSNSGEFNFAYLNLLGAILCEAQTLLILNRNRDSGFLKGKYFQLQTNYSF